MERDAFVQHGASNLLKERLMVSSDAYQTVICRTCGSFATNQINTGEIVCKRCDDPGEFGRIEIPYIFKVLIHYLSALNVQLTMKTKSSQ